MSGPPPKLPSERRNQAPKARGEWTALPAPEHLVPSMPRRGKGRGAWSLRTRRAWDAWWSDPASGMWGTADVELVEHLADIFEVWVREEKPSVLAEIRQARDSLGLTPKGRQDRRWSLRPLEAPKPDEQPAAPTEQANSTTVRRLRAVDLATE